MRKQICAVRLKSWLDVFEDRGQEQREAQEM